MTGRDERGSHPGPVTAGALAGAQAHEVLAALRAERPVAWIPDLQGWLVTRHDLAVRVLRDPEGFTVDDSRFSTARVVGPSMLSLDGPAHRRHRTPFVAPFRPSRVSERFGAEIESLSQILLDKRRADGHADLRTALAGPLAVAVVASALGLRDVDADTVLGWYGHIVDAVSAISIGVPVSTEAIQAMGALTDHLRTGLTGHTDSVLRDATRTLDEGEIIANAAVMMFGGIETTEGMITNAILHLLQHPGTADAVRADPSLASSAIEESLRLEPAAAAVDRYATRDLSLGDSDITSGDFVRVSITGANRDPAVFARPDDFDLHRDNLRAQLSFAQGPHVCIAMDLARLEARFAVLAAVQTLPGLKLAKPVEPAGLVFRKPASLQVTWSID